MFITCLAGVTPGAEVRLLDNDQLPVGLVQDWVDFGRLELAPGETAWKLSRHAFENYVFTWIGHYQHAYPKGDSKREGGFLGAGILCFDSRVRGAPAVAYVESVVGRLADLAIDGDRFSRKLADLPVEAFGLNGKHYLALERSQLPPAPGCGLRVGGDAVPNTLLVDLSPPADSGFLPFIIEWVQAGEPFEETDRVFISQSARLAAAPIAAVTIISVPDLFLSRRPESETATAFDSTGSASGPQAAATGLDLWHRPAGGRIHRRPDREMHLRLEALEGSVARLEAIALVIVIAAGVSLIVALITWLRPGLL